MAATRGGARQGARLVGHSGAAAVASVMATAGATDAVWHVRGHGEPEREWPRGHGRRAEGLGTRIGAGMCHGVNPRSSVATPAMAMADGGSRPRRNT